MKIILAVLLLMLALGLAGLTGCGRVEGRSLSSQTRTIVASNNAFAWQLYGQLKATKGNLFFSPFSISSCLAMTYAGARGNTERQIAQVLQFGTNEVHAAFGELYRQLNEEQKKQGIELNAANGLWAAKQHPFLPAFLEVARQQYGAQAQQFDFGTEAEPARADINAWVNSKTKGKIKDLIPSDLLDQYSKLVLVSAIYFKGTWQTKFDSKCTRDSYFHLNASETVQCPTMYCRGKFLYYHHYGPPWSCDVIELPYSGKSLSLVAILPYEWDELAELESNLTETNLAAWLSSAQETDVQVSLPKFTLKTEYRLDKTLLAMGMGDALTTNADFSGIDGTSNLYISWVGQQAFVEVNEEGTTAAAATATHHRTRGMRPSFRADHPFLFLIRDNRSGSILFLGRLLDPTK